MELYGIYEAICLSNSVFEKTGKIKVKLRKFSLDWKSDDLIDNYSPLEFVDELLNGFDCLVKTPIGGGDDFGFMAVPQPNTVGLVQFLNGNWERPIWVGSYHKPYYDENRKVEKVLSPTGDPESDGRNAIPDNNEYGKESIILKTKHTSSPTDGTTENIDWMKQNCENVFVSHRDGFKSVHVKKNKKKETILIQEIEVRSLDFFNDDGEYVSSKPIIKITIDDKINEKKIIINGDEEGLLLKYLNLDQEEFINSEIFLNDLGITGTVSDNEDNKSVLKIRPELVNIIQDESSIKMTENNISLTATKDVRISGNVVLGDTGGRVLLIPEAAAVSPVVQAGGVVFLVSEVKA